MVMNITDLKAYMNEAITDKLDHKNLDKDVKYFSNIPSTTENVAIFIWQNLKVLMKKPELLYEVKIYETDKNSVIYRGDILLNHSTNGTVQYSRKKHDSCTNISSDSD